MPVTDTPLRYPGGKTQISPFVTDLVRTNNLDRGIYAEPFAGGAGVAWRLLLNGDMSEVWLNDIDLAVYTFWDVVVNSPDKLCERILKADVSVKNWEAQRKILSNNNAKPIDLAFATLFLNRTNRSGILKGGIIGGKSQDGNYKIDCRFNREELIKKIQRIHLYKDVVKLSRLDAEACINKWAKDLPKRSLLNIDPPYYSQGRDLYLSFYKPEDHARLASLVRTLKLPWMLTYDDAPQIEQLYAGLPIYRKSLTYYAQVKRKASELLVLAPHLSPPRALLEDQAA